MTIYIASDHAGFELKEALKAHCISFGHEVKDFGAPTYDASDDYPDYIYPLAKALSADLRAGDTTETLRGIVIGGSGQGEAMTANRIPGIRAIVYYGKSADIISLSREHNDANVISFGARFVSIGEAITSLDQWLSLPFSNDERHIRRIGKLA